MSQREPGSNDELLGHPRGLAVIAGTELWVAVSIYGMQALLVLYMVESLLLPGSPASRRFAARSKA